MDINKVYTAKISASALLEQPNVVGLGVGYKWERGEQTDTLSIITLVKEKKPVAALLVGELIPPQIGSVKTDVQEVGILRPLQPLVVLHHTASRNSCRNLYRLRHCPVSHWNTGQSSLLRSQACLRLCRSRWSQCKSLSSCC